MDLQKIADSFHAPTCIISVEKKEDGGYGEIRLVAGNEEYVYPLEHPLFPKDPDKVGIPEVFCRYKKFVPGSLYEEYLPKDVGFEDICFRSAIKKIPVHTYVHMNLNYADVWFDIFCMPMEIEDDDLCYCAYTAVSSDVADVGISSTNSGTAFEDVIKTCIKLNGTHDLKETLGEVIKDIRLVCKADVCTILLRDEDNNNYSVIATDFAENCKVRRITSFSEFGDIAATFPQMFSDSNCIIIKNEQDWEVIHKANELWYNNLRQAGVTSLVLFPLKYNGEILGFIWATNFDTLNTIRIKETLELTTFFISSQLSTYKMMEHLRHISYTDQLTGLPNRAAFTELLSGLIKENEPFSVVSVDINGFKSINDTMGFDAGNKVLTEIADRWKAIADSRIAGTLDYIARLGGDEYALVIRDHRSEDEIINTIKQYEAALSSRLTVDNCDLYIQASFGYSVFPDDAKTTDGICTCANASMREVKRINSSNHILRFTPDLLKVERTLEIERKLMTALENDTISYHLQPQYDLSHKLRGFEALARMKDDKGNNISPGEFIPVAEKVGLVDKVDITVLRKSAEFVGKLIRETGADLILCANISVRHLMKNDCMDEIKEILRTSGLPSEHLEIEITESIMIDSAEKALRCIEEMHKMGIKIAIDDFGTGYSSLSYLVNFPADILKIDKSFIDKMNTSDSSKQYVAAIISIGHIMGFEVVTEGVEEEEQLETLRDIGCDYIQGYIWGRPMPADEAEKLVCGE